MTLAYAFWHAPADPADAAAYERGLVAFHRRLAEYRPEGFVHSWSSRIGPRTWFPGGGYEDWYVVEDWDALGRLGAGAVDADHVGTHDPLAALAGPGAGGLYGLVAGDPGVPPTTSVWFAKPADATYADFHRRMAPGPGAALWQRQLVLGPAPEYRRTGPGAALADAQDGGGRSVWPGPPG